MTCALTGPLQIQDIKAIAGPEGHEVFSERKGLSLFQNKVPNASLELLHLPYSSKHVFLGLSHRKYHLSLGCIADPPSETTL